MSDQIAAKASAEPVAQTPGPIYGVGQMPEQIRAFPWVSTPVGAIETWPYELICAVNQMLYSPLPGFIYWGPDFRVFYNDGSLPVLSGKHPQSLGQRAQEIWRELWHIIRDQLHSVFYEGKVLSFRKVPLTVLRNRGREDMYWDYAYTPICNAKGEILGIFNVAQDVTATVEAESKLKASEAQAHRVLESIGDAVIVTDSNARVVRMNPVAEQLTGWMEKDACEQPLTVVFPIVNETTREEVENPVAKVNRLNAVVGLANHTLLIARDGTESAIDDRAAPIRNDAGEITGTVLFFLACPRAEPPSGREKILQKG
jgi:PAS domain S-box-containing protein